jgi:hypothetical protein
MLTDEEAEQIRRGLAAGMRGPVLIKWCEQLLADRDEHVVRELKTQRKGWSGPLAGSLAWCLPMTDLKRGARHT